MRRLVFLLSAVVLLVSCSKHDEKFRNEPPSNPVLRAVWLAVYDNDYKYPDGFYTELDPEGTAIRYITNAYTDNNDWFAEDAHVVLSADDIDQARDMALREDQLNDPQYLAQLTERTTERFFEFILTLPQTRDIYLPSVTQLISRVYRSSYYVPSARLLDVSYYDIVKPFSSYVLGTYNGERTEKAVRELIETIWHYTTYSIGGRKVLETEFEATATRFRYTVFSTSVVGGDFGLYDRLSTWKSVFTLDKASGELRVESVEKLVEFDGKYNDSMVVVDI